MRDSHDRRPSSSATEDQKVRQRVVLIEMQFTSNIIALVLQTVLPNTDMIEEADDVDFSDSDTAELRNHKYN